MVRTTTSLVNTTTHLVCLDTHHIPWIHTTKYFICIDTYHYTAYMPWYTPLGPLHTLYALVPSTTHLICLGTRHFTLYMPWYTPLFTIHALVHTFYALVHALHALVHTTTNHIPWYTLYMLWYPPLHTLYANVCAMCNSTVHHAQLCSKKDELCTRFFFNNSNSIRLTKLKLTVHIVGVLMYICKKWQFSMMWSFRAISKFAKNEQLHTPNDSMMVTTIYINLFEV